MTDLEMTRLCAEAIGLVEDEQTTRSISYREDGHIWTRHEADPIGKMYHPIHDDAQAMALVKYFNLSCGWDYSGLIWCETKTANPFIVIRDATNLNRAIVECVAMMQLRRTEPQRRSE